MKKSARDNRANQLNPKHSAYSKSRIATEPKRSGGTSGTSKIPPKTAPDTPPKTPE